MEILDKIKYDIHNNFVLKLYGGDGKLKQEAYAENIVLNQAYINGSAFSNTYVGSGTGSLDPSRQSLFNITGGNVNSVKSVNLDVPTSSAAYETTLPAGEATGAITEVGLGPHANAMSTHAFIEDSEGNPITVNKLPSDVLTVKATVYVTVAFEPPLLAKPATPESLASSPVYLLLNNAGAGFNIAQRMARFMVSTGAMLTDSLEMPANSYNNFMTMVNTTIDISSRAASFPLATLPAQQANYGFANAIEGDMWYVPLPCADLFPPQRLEPMLVGVGDGVTVDFACPIPEFVEGTEEIRVGGVLLTAGTDYTIDSQGNSILNSTSKYAHSATGMVDDTGAGAIIPAYGFMGAARWRQAAQINAANGIATYDFTDPVEVNAFVIKNITGAGGVTFALQYSLDGKATWQTAASVTVPTSPWTNPNPLLTFDPVTAKYWRVTKSPTSSVNITANDTFFGLVGGGITFTTPPANGANITISAEVDRPWKDADRIWQLSAVMGY